MFCKNKLLLENWISFNFGLGIFFSMVIQFGNFSNPYNLVVRSVQEPGAAYNEPHPETRSVVGPTPHLLILGNAHPWGFRPLRGGQNFL